MFMLETLKKSAERLTGLGRPSGEDVQKAVRSRKANTFRFEDDGLIPNNPLHPAVIYNGALNLSRAADPAALFEELFHANGWDDSWRDSIYDYVHYHSRIHEILGIARGRGRVQIGGPKGRKMDLKAGDVVILPAGTGHQLMKASKDFLVVGAYPPTGKYDECRSSRATHDKVAAGIARVALPKKDPVYGTDGPLPRLWRKRRVHKASR